MINLDREKDFLRGFSKFIREGMTSPAPETYEEIMKTIKTSIFAMDLHHRGGNS